MIQLQLKIDPLPIEFPLVVRLRVKSSDSKLDYGEGEAPLIARDETMAEFDVAGFSLRVHTTQIDDLDGDVVLVLPGARIMHRLIRKASNHNTFLLTEQCDQKCIMCSQPPKKYHRDLFDQFFEAVRLAPKNITIGLSGGEPFLHKDRLFNFLRKAQEERPDLRFHILTNAQHFSLTDKAILQRLDQSSLLWGIPIYSACGETHDRIVEKSGAFETLQENLALLGSVGACIELRTVLLKSNVDNLEELAAYILAHFSFAQVWAIMQLENIGYARMNWQREFFDNSILFDDLALGIDLAIAKGLNTSLYNFPLCTVPEIYRTFCVASISDWKQKFLEPCLDCTAIQRCSGFFEWYPEKSGFKEVRSL
jgi:His-Xaa-Ser system radical SAM maturase HxsC